MVREIQVGYFLQGLVVAVPQYCGFGIQIPHEYKTGRWGINADDVQIRQNRWALLKQLQTHMNQVADISRLAQ